MPQFRYRAVTHAGEIVVGEVDASSREEVVRRIEYLGHLTIEAELAATGILARGHRRGGKLPELSNPEMKPTSTAMAVLFWLGLAGLTFVLLIVGYGSGFWRF